MIFHPTQHAIYKSSHFFNGELKRSIGPFGELLCQFEDIAAPLPCPLAFRSGRAIPAALTTPTVWTRSRGRRRSWRGQRRTSMLCGRCARASESITNPRNQVENNAVSDPTTDRRQGRSVVATISKQKSAGVTTENARSHLERGRGVRFSGSELWTSRGTSRCRHPCTERDGRQENQCGTKKAQVWSKAVTL